ncbi:MAG: YdcF family protein [Mucilaginibacter sp.]
MKKEIIIILGSPNSDSGELGAVAKSRLDHCLHIYTKSMFVLCTGGWGKHFNTTRIAHAVYAKNYLIERGIPGDAFLPGALSENSVDDAVKVKEVISEIPDPTLTVITSDFHLERVRLIFTKILNDHSCSFVGVPAALSVDELQIVTRHEQEAIRSILQNGLYY